MAPNDQAIPEALYRNAINLNRYSNSVSKRIITAYNDIILETSAQLAAIDPVTSPGTTLRLRTILAQLEESLGTWVIDSKNVTQQELQGLAVLQTEFIQDQLRNLLPSDAAKNAVRTVEISPQFAEAVVTTDPTRVNVFNLPQDLQSQITGARPTFSLTARDGAVITLPNGATVQKAFRGIAEVQTDLYVKTVQNGLAVGQTTQQIARNLKGRLQFGQEGNVRQIAAAGGQLTKVANKQVMTLVRTSINQVSNAATQKVYEANQDITDEYRYVATLDSRTSAICSRLDGQIFKYGKGPQPPQHFNCRSVTVAVISDNFLKEFGLTREDLNLARVRPSKTGLAQIGKTVPANQNYATWLSKQDIALQNEVFGIKRSALFRKELKKGRSPTDVLRQFIREDGTELNLKELERITKNS